jgi:hypothetical protein
MLSENQQFTTTKLRISPPLEMEALRFYTIKQALSVGRCLS